MTDTEEVEFTAEESESNTEPPEGFIAHQLSPSSWNRYEECPRKYWLSRQGLPRKASMPAELGKAVHNSVEDLCNLNLSDREDDESG